VIIGALYGIAACDAAAGAQVAIATEGVYDLQKNAPDAFAVGAVAKAVPGGSNTIAAAGTAAIGIVVAPAAAGAVTVRVLFGPVHRRHADRVGRSARRWAPKARA
jgi:predicted RecA/RadA family phage recombinase